MQKKHRTNAVRFSTVPCFNDSDHTRSIKRSDAAIGGAPVCLGNRAHGRCTDVKGQHGSGTWTHTAKVHSSKKCPLIDGARFVL